MYLTVFLFLSWGLYFKSMGIVYLLYYALNIGYDYLRTGQKQRAESDEMVYELPITPNISPVEVTLPSPKADSETPYNNQNADNTQGEVEEHSMNITEYMESHKRNIGKAMNAFS
jgi:hypothetical protein